MSDLLAVLETGRRPRGGVAALESGVPSISAEQMNANGGFDFSTVRYVPPDFYDEMPTGHLRTHDILIVKDGATTGKVAIVGEGFRFPRAAINEHVFLCRPDRAVVVPEFLFWWLWSPVGKASILVHYRGAAIGGINRSFAEGVQVPVAPHAEQQRIAVLLNEQMAAVERARAACEEQLAAAQALPAAFLREVFESEEARGWPSTRLDALSPTNRGITYGVVQTGAHTPGGVPTIRAGDIRDFTVRRTALKLIAPALSAQFSRTILRGDEALLAIRGSVGAVAEVTDALVGANVSREVAVIPLRPDVRQRWVVFACASPMAQAEVLSKIQGAAQRGINLADVAALKIPMPPRSAQERIVARLDQRLNEMEGLRGRLEGQRTTIAALPAALLRQAFAGNL